LHPVLLLPNLDHPKVLPPHQNKKQTGTVGGSAVATFHVGPVVTVALL